MEYVRLTVMNYTTDIDDKIVVLLSVEIEDLASTSYINFDTGESQLSTSYFDLKASHQEFELFQIYNSHKTFDIIIEIIETLSGTAREEFIRLLNTKLPEFKTRYRALKLKKIIEENDK